MPEFPRILSACLSKSQWSCRLRFSTTLHSSSQLEETVVHYRCRTRLQPNPKCLRTAGSRVWQVLPKKWKKNSGSRPSATTRKFGISPCKGSGSKRLHSASPPDHPDHWLISYDLQCAVLMMEPTYSTKTIHSLATLKRRRWLVLLAMQGH